MLYEQLPVSDRHHSVSDVSLLKTGKQGPDGGAAAPSGPQHSDSAALGSQPAMENPSHQALASPASHPCSPAGEAATFAGIPGPVEHSETNHSRAMEDVMAERMRQVLKFGHSAQQDLETPLWQHREFTELGRRSFMRMLADHLSSAIEYASFGRGKYDLARRYLVKTAALCLAAIDRIDAETADTPTD